MARIRTIKPEFWEDEKMADIPMLARLFFIGTWNFADDFGVILNSPKYLKSKIFPYDESLREAQVITWLNALINARMLVPFDYKNKSYLYIRTFMSHQVIDKRYTKSILPEGISAEKVLAGLGFQQNTTYTHSEHDVNTRQEEEKEEEKERNRKRKEHASAHEDLIFPFDSENFLQAWNLWKNYRREQHRFVFKNLAEQAALKDLSELCQGSEEKAIAIIHQSINKGWAGLFQLKIQNQHQNGNRKNEPGTKRPILLAAEEALRRASGDNAE